MARKSASKSIRGGAGKDALPVMVTAAEIREHLGIQDRTLGRWFAQGLAVERDKSGHNPRVKLWDLVEWIYRRDGVPESGEGSESPALERLRLAKAEEAERRNKREEGLLVEIAEVRREYRQIAHALRAQLEALVRVRPDVEVDLRAALETAAKSLEKSDRDDAGAVA